LFGVLIGLLAHHLIVWWRTRDHTLLPCLGAFLLLGLYFANRLGHLPPLAPEVGAYLPAVLVWPSALVLSVMAWRGVRGRLAGAAPFAVAWACLAAVLLLATLPQGRVVAVPGLADAG